MADDVGMREEMLRRRGWSWHDSVSSFGQYNYHWLGADGTDRKNAVASVVEAPEPWWTIWDGISIPAGQNSAANVAEAKAAAERWLLEHGY